ELNPHRAALKIERAALPQPVHGGLEGPAREQGRGSGPQARGVRVHAPEHAAGQAQHDARSIAASSQLSPRSHAVSLLARRTRSTAASGGISPLSSQRRNASAREAPASRWRRSSTSPPRSTSSNRARAASPDRCPASLNVLSTAA